MESIDKLRELLGDDGYKQAADTIESMQDSHEICEHFKPKEDGDE